MAVVGNGGCSLNIDRRIKNIFLLTLGSRRRRKDGRRSIDKPWAFRYWLYGVVVCAPMFYMLQKMSYSKENVEKWAEIRRKQFSGETHH
ncbi:hypothetical protein KM043_009774 [Ampulex compressa]|nr:hypothetical protein KM043_009774 [Ampulex compressa]